MLYLVATPIGNLGDITYRAVEILKSCSYILCEDTRHSRPLLQHYAIENPLKSYHKFNERARLEEILTDLRSGLDIALISDAGTPGIADPGADLVAACVQEGFTVHSIPGPCAFITALTCSGFATERFQFRGFLPRKAGELKEELLEILDYPGTTVCYESPLRLLNVLKMLQQLAPERKIGVARELTKKFEESVQGTAAKLLEYYQTETLKGEVVLLIDANHSEDSTSWLELPVEEHVELLEKNYQLTRQEAIKLASKQRDIPKREIYNKLMKN